MTYQTLKGIFPVISAFRTPTGYVELVSYKENGHKVTDTESIPYAAALTIQPGNGQPAISKSYEYSSVHNFLGYSSGRTSFDSSQDNLYLVTGKYTYSSIERVLNGQNVISVTERVFDKFHLMTKEAKTQDNKRITTEITYNEDPSKSFSEQPENLQQPSHVLTRYTDLQTNTSREESVNIKSDDWGNTLLITETSGIQKEYVYYPVNNQQTITTFKYEYSDSEMITNSTVTGFDGAHMESKNVTSIYTHRQLRKVDVNHAITDQSYDLSGRIIGQIIDPGTTKEIKRNYVYQYPGGDENDASNLVRSLADKMERRGIGSPCS
ncbi:MULTISPECIES: hypothetical protein [Photorhabdus]|uniref:hypothetical protein n=1 Tax=Photorhabdus TaxID=29487 RepID=UPI0021D4F712|nr:MULTISPECIES: hypothetical protein [Photorhabdus]MCT8352383.1 hypothetical protein [Photorhabdus kayaii]MDB6368797.1 hypothetical protein [Photorhabdus bodei]